MTYNHIDPPEKQLPLPVQLRDLPAIFPFTADPIVKQVALPTADGGSVVLELKTNSEHLATFFEKNWPANMTDKPADATIIAVSESAETYGFDTDYNTARWYSPDTRQVWIFNNEFYGNLKITVRGLCSEIAPLEQMFVHGCSMAIDGRGVVLSGVSGAGKTTLTAAIRKQLGDRVRIINDDWGPLSFETGMLRFTNEPNLHMKYPSVSALAPSVSISPETHLSENFNGDNNDPHARLIMPPTQVFGEDGMQPSATLAMFIMTVRDPDMPAGIRRFTAEDMPLLETGRYSKFYAKTEWFLNGSLFITDDSRKERETKRHTLLTETFPCYLVNNILTPEESASLIIAELDKTAPVQG